MMNILPEFESRQVLTSDELNWLASYLDQQNRLSRRMLVGAGVVGGLAVRLSGNSIQVSNGVALTSAGHLLTVAKEGAAFTTFTKARKYSQKAAEKLAFHYLSDLSAVDENYTKSVEGASLYFPGFTGEVLELFEETANEAPALDGATAKGKVALLFAEIIQKEVKDCEGDNCQERGKKYVFSPKVLLVSKDDALRLLGKEFGLANPTETALSQLAFPWLHLPNVTILKPVFSNNAANATFDEKLLIAAYTRCIQDFLTVLLANKASLEAALRNLRAYCGGSAAEVAVVTPLVEAVKATGVADGKATGVALYEVVYDYLWCFTRAYTELQATAQGLRARCFTGEAGFPNHVLLGLVDTDNPDFDEPVPVAYSVYRHGFQARLPGAEQAEVSRQLTGFFNRLQALGTAFESAVLTLSKDLRITPGGSLYGPLSQQAIPYYLKASAAKHWRSWSLHPGLGKYVTSYSTTAEGSVASAQTPYASLPSAFQGDHSFFRIEGVYGQAALTALNGVFQLRKKHGLPFEVLMLRLNEKAPFSHSFNFSINEDIESMYQVVRAEALKQVGLNVAYLAALQIKSEKYNQIQTLLTRALEESYFTFIKGLNLGLVAKLDLALPTAIMASNITNNVKAAAVTTEAKYQELEMAMVSQKTASASMAKMESINITGQKTTAQAFQFIQPLFLFDFTVFFFNTLGNLVTGIRNSDKFKNTTDASFYTHLLLVAKGLKGREGQPPLFLLVLQLYASLKLQEEYLAENFLELDVEKYKANLDDELLRTAAALADYLKKVTTDPVKEDEYLLEVGKTEMIAAADRIRFDDDWVKIIQLDAENKKRNGGLGVENLLERFVRLHPGLSHGCGVPRGGTYIMVYDAANLVAADFYLPYLLSSHLRPIQYTLVESKTLTLSGTVRDVTGKPVETSLLVGGATVLTDKQGFYNALVGENTTVKLVCRVEGYEPFEQDVAVTNKPVTFDVQLRPLPAKKTTTTLKFFNQTGKPVAGDIKLVTTSDNKALVAKAGVLALTDVPKTVYKLKVQDEAFAEQEFDVVVADGDNEQKVDVVERSVVRIQLVGKTQAYVPTLLRDIQVTDPEMNLDKAGLAQGTFVTKERLNLGQQATVKISYGERQTTETVVAGQANSLFVDPTPLVDTRKLRTLVGIFYPANQRMEKLKSVTLNGTVIKMNPDTNIGEAEITTDGQLQLGGQFRNGGSIEIPNFQNARAAIVLMDATLFKEADRITPNSFFSFTRAIPAIQARGLMAFRSELSLMLRATGIDGELYFAFMLGDSDVGAIKLIFR